ncbi:class I SAM-dependent methyltransferase [Maricaulis parjimensis]|uniref:class I SAM-dependent methyltransferase n=1 Tax=Maricaulis parjimensis TaxID=144023 RepID=UPI00193A9F84|nr:methyltransferase domain-containing protein [Maricaulis parjimensis]
MRSILMSGLSACALLALSACGNPAEEPAEDTVAEAPETMVEAEPAPDYSDITTVLAAEWRGEAAERDAWRHPAETLEFFGVDPSSTIVEIWPGGGWYSDVLAPWISANGGTYVAAHFPANSTSAYRQRSRASFEERVAANAAYGEPVIADFNAEIGLVVPAGSVDAVLTFRNIHNWMAGGSAERAFAEFYTALKPGGIMGVVEHRLPSTREQDPMAGSGYVQQDYVIAMAEEAGFEFVEASEINANPADTADHPMGVWTLPPTRRSPGEDDPRAEGFNREQIDAIGESDRMTLLFRKPETVEE